MLPLSRIVCPLDFSEPSQKALQTAIEFEILQGFPEVSDAADDLNSTIGVLGALNRLRGQFDVCVPWCCPPCGPTRGQSLCAIETRRTLPIFALMEAVRLVTNSDIISTASRPERNIAKIWRTCSASA
jgi:hypothetical protein